MPPVWPWPVRFVKNCVSPWRRRYDYARDNPWPARPNHSTTNTPRNVARGCADCIVRTNNRHWKKWRSIDDDDGSVQIPMRDRIDPVAIACAVRIMPPCIKYSTVVCTPVDNYTCGKECGHFRYTTPQQQRARPQAMDTKSTSRVYDAFVSGCHTVLATVRKYAK